MHVANTMHREAGETSWTTCTQKAYIAPGDKQKLHSFSLMPVELGPFETYADANEIFYILPATPADVSRFLYILGIVER